MDVLASEYEESGFFDKDEQGWCSNMVRVWQEGDTVFIRQWHDANGIIRADKTRRGHVASSDALTINIALEGGGTAVLDRKTAVLIRG